MKIYVYLLCGFKTLSIYSDNQVQLVIGKEKKKRNSILHPNKNTGNSLSTFLSKAKVQI